MTHRERLLAAIRGETVDRIPFAPRMDLWYIANRGRGSLPAEFRDMNTVEIARAMDVACHAVRADYTLPRARQDLVLRGLGLDNHPDYPYRVEMHKYPVHFESDAENLRTRIETPKGDIVTHISQSQAMLRDGISLPMVHRYPATRVDDFEALALVFEHLEVIPTPGNYRAFRERIGDQGIAVANGLPVASPLHFLLHDLMPMDAFFYLCVDNRPALLALAARMETFFHQVLAAVTACDCEVFLWGGNYDESTTYPDFYAQDLQPWLGTVGTAAERHGKFALSHTDGESRALLPLFRATRFQVAESVCTAPMTRCTLKEFRDGIGADTTVWGGIPAVALLADSMDEATFEQYLDTLFAEIGNGRRLILGVSDNVPPDAVLPRLQRIEELSARYYA